MTWFLILVDYLKVGETDGKYRYIPAGHMLPMFRVFLSFWEQDLLLAGWTSVTPAGLSYTSRFSDLKAPTWSIILGFIFLLNFLFGFWLSERHAQFCKII